MNCKTNYLYIWIHWINSLVIQWLIHRDIRPTALGRVICYNSKEKCNKDIILYKKNKIGQKRPLHLGIICMSAKLTSSFPRELLTQCRIHWMHGTKEEQLHENETHLIWQVQEAIESLYFFNNLSTICPHPILRVLQFLILLHLSQCYLKLLFTTIFSDMIFMDNHSFMRLRGYKEIAEKYIISSANQLHTMQHPQKLHTALGWCKLPKTTCMV